MKRIFITILIIIISMILGTTVLGATGTVTSDELNVRSAASTNSNSMGKLHKNDIVSILEEENDEWYKIDYDDNIGFVYKEYVEVKADDSNDSEPAENSTEENTTQKEEETENKEETDNNNNNKLLKDAELYILPLLNSIKINTLKAETEVKIISNNGKWLYIQTDTESGWIIANTLIEQNNEQQEDNNEEIENNETKNNETKNNETTSETNNDESENSTSENVTVEENTNKTSEAQSENNDEYPITMYVTGDSVNIRKSASTSSTVISGTAKNASIKVIGKEGDWYKVDTEDGIGYIKADLLSKQKN